MTESEGGGYMLQVDVPTHGGGAYQEVSVVMISDSEGSWHGQDNMVFSTGNYSTIMDLPSNIDPPSIFQATQEYVDNGQILHKEDESIYHTIFVDQGQLSEEEINRLNPSIRDVVGSGPVSRVVPLDISLAQFRSLQRGQRVVLARSSTDEDTCAAHTSVIFDHPTSHCWQWVNPVTGNQIGVHQIVVNIGSPGSPTPDPDTISCCHHADANTATSGPLATEVADCCDRYHPSLCTCTDNFFDTSITVSHEQFVEECWDCANIKTRKNVNSLSTAEITELTAALGHVTSSPTSTNYVDIANYHGYPWMCNLVQSGPTPSCSQALSGTNTPIAYCPCCKPHLLGDNIHFLTWHRLFNLQMEWALQEHDSSLTMPYWDWTQTGSLPSFWPSGALPNGPWPIPSACNPTSFNTQRNFGGLPTATLGSLVQSALEETNLLGFNTLLETPHNWVHGSIGCDMATVDRAAYDPIFYLHHGYIDYLFAYWQELQSIRGLSSHDPASSEMNLNLEPSNRASNPNPRSLRYSQGRHTFDYRTSFCHEYDELLFNGWTPSDFPGRKKRQSNRGLTPLQFYYAEKRLNEKDRLFVGVSMRKTGITSKQTITVCIEEACSEAVQLATFASTNRAPEFEPQISNPFLVRYEVTNLKIGPAMLDTLASRTKLIARVTSYSDQGGNDLPLNMTYQPVIIWRPGDLAREENGLQVLDVQVLEETVLADRIFSNPPFKVVFYREKDVLAQQTFYYQRQTFQIPQTNQRVIFGHEEFYRCEEGRAYSNLVGQVTVIDFGFTEEGQFLNPTEEYHHSQGKLLLIVWCSGSTN